MSRLGNEACDSDVDPLVLSRCIGLFQCPRCEWAATTGAGWDECPYCLERVQPLYRLVHFNEEASRG